MSTPAPELAAGFPFGPYAAVFAPLPEAGRADVVTRRLGESIAFGLLPDGSQLPAEPELAERFGVATVTIRESLATLREEGLVRTRRGRGGGSFVCVPSDGGLAAMGRRLLSQGIGVLRDHFDHYAILSGGAAALAAQRADGEDLVRLRRHVEREEGCTAAGFPHVDAQWHIDVAASAQSARLTRSELAFQGELGPAMWLAHTTFGDLARTRQEHAAVVEAIGKRQVEPARSLMEQHVRSTFASVRAAFVAARLGELG